MSAQHLTLDEAMSIGQMAFLPYQASTRADKQDASFSLHVVNGAGDEILSIAHIGRSQYLDPVHFAGLLEKARLQLSRDGVQLTAWSMPMQPGPAE